MNDYWKSLSERERRLAVITCSLTAVLMCAWLGMRAVTTLSDLNSDIARLEQELENLTNQQALGASVQSAFEQVEEAHSSDWSEEEISDRLRREIYRLALRRPYPPGQSVPTRSSATPQYMIRIPVMREGALSEFEDGYREYQVPIQIPRTTLSELLIFIERIQKSPQMLRVDSLQLARPPQGQNIKVSMEVTRTVVNTTGGPIVPLTTGVLNLAENPGMETWDRQNRSFVAWEASDCTLARSRENVTEGSWSMQARSEGGSGSVYQVQSLESGKPYTLVLDVTAASAATLSVLLGDHSPLGKAIELEPASGPQRYEIRFVPPGALGDTQQMLAPYIAFGSDGGNVFVDNVWLIAAGT